MTRRKRAPGLVQGAINNLRTMRQYADLPESEIELLALARVHDQLSGEPLEGSAPLPALSFFNDYVCDAGQAVLGNSLLIGEDGEGELPSLVHWQEEAVPGVTDDPSDLPARTYDVSLHRQNGKVKGLYLSLDWTRA